MTYIANINNNELDLDFQIVNKEENEIPIKVSFVNALRRTILSDIPIINASEIKTQFIKNSSMLNNEILAHRMNLLSVINDDFVDKNFDNIVIRLNRKNNKDEIETVYVKDFELMHNGSKLDVEKVFKYPNTIFAKIKHNQSIVMNSVLEKHTVKENGAGHCPVSTCYYYFEYDKSSEDENRERHYKKDNLANPLIYNFFIESSGQLSAVEIFRRSISVLINNLEIVKDDIKNKYKNKVIIKKSDTRMKALDFHLINETDTIANLIVQHIDYVDKVDYKGYDLVHPLKKEIVVRIAYGDNTEEETSKLFIKTIDFIIDFAKKFQDEWNKLN